MNSVRRCRCEPFALSRRVCLRVRLIATGRGALRREPRRRWGASSFAGKTNEGESHSHLTTVDRNKTASPLTTLISSCPLSFVRCVSIVDRWLVSEHPASKMKSGGHGERQQDRRHVRSLPCRRLCRRRGADDRLEDPERAQGRGADRRAHPGRMELCRPARSRHARPRSRRCSNGRCFPACSPIRNSWPRSRARSPTRKRRCCSSVRSGARSAAAAKAMTAAGYSTCLNVADGFEGPLDAQAKRGSAGGWKAAGLPWRQT